MTDATDTDEAFARAGAFSSAPPGFVYPRGLEDVVPYPGEMQRVQRAALARLWYVRGVPSLEIATKLGFNAASFDRLLRCTSLADGPYPPGYDRVSFLARVRGTSS